MQDLTSVSTLVDGLVKVGLLDGFNDISDDFDSFTDCADMSEMCFTCPMYTDCLSAVNEEN